MSGIPKTWLCRKCGEGKPIKGFRIRVKATGLAIDNSCLACKGRSEFSRLKLEMLEAFGWKCNCCGEDHPQFLTLEHIQGIAPFFVGGTAYQRRKNGGRIAISTYMAYRNAKKEGWDRTKYECLCMNCNFAKGHFGQCPHRTGLTKEDFIESLRRKTTGIGRTFRQKKTTTVSAGKFEVGAVLSRIEKESL